jgi:hypothetical protein
MSPFSKPIPRRVWLLSLFLLAVPISFLARPAIHLVRWSFRDKIDIVPLTPGIVDDNSRLNQTKVAEVWPIPSDVAQAERDIVSLIARARRDKLPISIAGARHSMGGHTIAPSGIMLDMLPFHQMQLDATTIPTSFFRTSFI